MKKIFLTAIAACTFLAANAQDIVFGSFENLIEKKKGVVEYNYAQAKINRSSLSIDEVIENNEWKRWRPQQEKWCKGSLNDDLAGIMEFDDYKNPDFILTLIIQYIDKDFDNPICDAVFTGSNGEELLKINGIATSDLNDTGHALAKMIRKNFKSIRSKKK